MSSRVVSYFDQSEFEYIYACIKHKSDWPTAIKRINAWRSRGKLSPSIDASCSLMEALSASTSHNNERLILSMAFIRFFNCLVDQSQTGKFAQSVAMLAETLGLPGWFVDLRHAATHDHLPCLPVLINGCTQALGWLQANYWDKMMESTSVEGRNDEAAVDLLLKQYKDDRKAEIKAKEGKKKVNSAIKRLDAALSKSSATRSSLISKMIGVGYLIPNSRSQRAINDYIIPAICSDLWVPLLERIDLAHDDSFLFKLFIEIVRVLYSVEEPSSVSCNFTLGTFF
jgi:hypothetical protein